MPWGWTSGQPAAIDEGVLGGRWPVRVRRDSGAGMARIAGTGRSAGEGCGPGGLASAHWGSGS